MKKSNLLFDAFRFSCVKDDTHDATSKLLGTIGVLFFSWNLRFSIAGNLSSAYPLSLRRTAYHVALSQDYLLGCQETPLVKPKGEIDLNLVSHLTNFWKFHLAICDEGHLKDMYSDLPLWMRIPAWTPDTVQNENELGHKWKGALCE